MHVPRSVLHHIWSVIRYVHLIIDRITDLGTCTYLIIDLITDLGTCTYLIIDLITDLIRRRSRYVKKKKN